MPAIILEGPEKAGKSTTAKELIRQAIDSKLWRNVTYVHHIHGDSIPHIVLKEAKLYAESENTLFIVDRWYSSEYVYTKLTGRSSTMRDYTLHYAETNYGNIVSKDGLLCMLYANPKTLEIRRDDTDIIVNPKEEILAYKEICDTKHKWLHLNTDVEETKVIANQLLSVI